MNCTKYIIGLLLIILFSCNNNASYTSQDLVKLKEEDLLERAKEKKIIDLKKVIYKNEKGQLVSADSANQILSTGNWTFDRYADANGEVRELILRKMTEEDRAFNVELLQAYTAKPLVKPRDIDCSNKAKILDEVYELDQKGRKSGDEDFQQYDEQNLITVVSLIENCGMPTLEEVNERQMNAIWYVIQHADNTHRKKYFEPLKEAAEKGDLKKSQVAKMQDRILFYDGKQQIYGTQVVENPETQKMELYQLKQPELVDKRRKEVGLGPLKAYLAIWDIPFDIKQIE